jgi:hypothetical protein
LMSGARCTVKVLFGSMSRTFTSTCTAKFGSILGGGCDEDVPRALPQ